ncbi:hypothetical protein SEA_FUZZBUSTER_51 [Microbacterium phage FuzzBuster]|uniref:Uncharacterized protein n=1 Tax=Microbacterium phage FuzzBuster TaxID=2590935 RepID=A0A516KV29_9CAUD|nr:hypothetical protein SEA_FUZZBUSTER_51 [Microbacterium phage FuzzBuster]
MTHAIITAAREFAKDESRRDARGFKRRLPGGGRAILQLVGGTLAAESPTSPEGVASPEMRNGRGSLAVEIFGYSDTFDEQAATVITDILHAVAARGLSPQAVLNQAAAYYAEER